MGYENATSQLRNFAKLGYSKILVFSITLLFIFILVGSFTNKKASIDQANFRYDPPDLIKYTVQKVDSAHINIRATFNHFYELPPSLTVYMGQDSLVMNDVGLYPDNTAGDNVFSVKAQIDMDEFLNGVVQRNAKLTQQGYYTKFVGHNGEMVDSVKLFDVNAFNAGFEVEMHEGLISIGDCSDETLKKHKSLFITDLSVVEDPARTFNFIDETGNPNGIYTFGNMMKNMANSTTTGVSTKDFIKSWIKSYTIDITTPNSVSGTLQKREEVIKFLIRPWLTKAENPSASLLDQSITLINWESRWDQANENNILKWAPFRLTAISNRLDLRGSGMWVKNLNSPLINDGYYSHKMQAGETRFIYTLVNLLSNDNNPQNASIVKGEIPTNIDGDFTNSDFLDWKGMNVILEYLNPHDKTCDLIDFAHDWLNLSELEFGENYNYALEQITKQVINANAFASLPNSSALGRLRSNEKIFFPAQRNNPGTWNPSDWQFRQFEIEATTNKFAMVPTTNAPIMEVFSSSHNLPSSSAMFAALTDWLYTPYNKWLVKRERHILPLTHNSYPMTDMAATNSLEFTAYLDLPYTTQTTYFNPATEINQNNALAKELRHKLSLNTCQGCHGGENKTLFTMVSPLKFGEEAKYWETTPSTKYGNLDVRLSAPPANVTVVHPNAGKTIETEIDPQTGLPYPPTPNYDLLPPSARYYINVSAFITGRTFDGTSFQDDEVHNTPDNASDNQMERFYWVNDPSNVPSSTDPNNFFGNNDRKNGFNELKRRSIDLCGFLTECNGVNPIWMFQEMKRFPMSE